MSRQSYHHGDLRAAVVDEALVLLAQGSLDELSLPTPPAGASPLEHSAYAQFARGATELSAMLLAAQPAGMENPTPLPVKD